MHGFVEELQNFIKIFEALFTKIPIVLYKLADNSVSGKWILL